MKKEHYNIGLRRPIPEHTTKPPLEAFKEMYFKLPLKARSELFIYHNGEPRSLDVVNFEVSCSTRLSKELLEILGYGKN